MARWEFDPNVRRGRSVVTDLHVHLVFVTKYRRAVFTPSILDTCESSMRKVCEDSGATLDEFNGEADHVHLLVRYPPTVRLSDLVNSLKGVSSRLIRRDHPKEVQQMLWGKHFWSPSYFAASAGGAPLEIVKRYIQDQKTPQPRLSSRP